MSNDYRHLLDIGAISPMEYRALCEISARQQASREHRNAARHHQSNLLTGEPNMDAEYLLRKIGERRANITAKLDALTAQRNETFGSKSKGVAGTTAVDEMVADVMANAFASLKSMAECRASPEASRKDSIIEADFTVVEKSNAEKGV